MSKICTSIEQSKKLIELGLNINTSDMYYFGLDDHPYQYYELMVGKIDKDEAEDFWHIPAWSLSALLELMPFYLDFGYGNVELNYHTSNDAKYVFNYGYLLSHKITVGADNPLDAAYKMIVWLLENKKI